MRIAVYHGETVNRPTDPASIPLITSSQGAGIYLANNSTFKKTSSVTGGTVLQVQ